MQRFYAAHPINTYGTPLEREYLEYLCTTFPDTLIVDPNSESVTRAVDQIKEQDSRDPLTGQFSEGLYNSVGAKVVIEYFVALVEGVDGGAGLALPTTSASSTVTYMLPAGIAKELRTIDKLGHPTWVVTCSMERGMLCFNNFAITHVCVNEARTTSISQALKGGEREEMFDFVMDDGRSFGQLSIQETRERIYTKCTDGSWDRKKLQHYVLTSDRA